MNESADPRRLAALTEGLTRACPYLFLVLSLATSLFLAWNLPPFQGADELAHFDRANMAAAGHLIGERVETPDELAAGGPEEVALYAASAAFDDLHGHPEVKVNTARYNAGLKRWGGEVFPAQFTGAASYPVFFYLPASAGVALGKAMGLAVTPTVYMARMVQAVACCLIGFLALLWSGRSRLFLYSVLLLPMAAALYGGVNNDGGLITVTALGCALIGRAMTESRPMRRKEVIGAAVCFALVGMTKLPYALFGLAFLVVPTERPRWRPIAAGAVLAAAFAWTLAMGLLLQVTVTRPDVSLDPAGQVGLILHHPQLIAIVATHTLGLAWRIYGETFVGVLGWLDTYLPGTYYPLAEAMLVVAAVASAAGVRPAGWRSLPWVSLAIIVAVFAGIFGALYITWTPIGSTFVEGVQGRYFLPLACFACLALEGSRSLIPDTGLGRSVRLVLTGAVLIFPLISLLIVERAVIQRYYLA